MPFDSLQEFGYKSANCLFCKSRIPFESGVSWQGVGKIDDIGCAICRVPVCERCSIHWWESDGDIDTHFRVCKTCQIEYQISKPGSLPPKNIAHFRFCQVCETKVPKIVSNCGVCNRLLCPSCRQKNQWMSLCPECHSASARNEISCSVCKKVFSPTVPREKAGAWKCPSCAAEKVVSKVQCSGCGKPIEETGLQGIERAGKCVGCSRKFCSSCLVLVKVKGVMKEACGECRVRFDILNDPLVDEKTRSAYAQPKNAAAPESVSMFEKAKTFFASLLSSVAPATGSLPLESVVGRFSYANFLEFQKGDAEKKLRFYESFATVKTLPYPIGQKGKTAVDVALQHQKREYAHFLLAVLICSLESNPDFCGTGTIAKNFGRQYVPVGTPGFCELRDFFGSQKSLVRGFLSHDGHLSLPDRGFICATAVVRFFRTGEEVAFCLPKVVPFMAPNSVRCLLEAWWVVDTLIEWGWDVNARNRKGDTLLHLLMRSIPSAIGSGIASYAEKSRRVIDAGASLEQANQAGETPLGLARKKGLDLEMR